MAAYHRVYDSRHLQADCQELGPAPARTLRSAMEYGLPLPVFPSYLICVYTADVVEYVNSGVCLELRHYLRSSVGRHGGRGWVVMFVCLRSGTDSVRRRTIRSPKSHQRDSRARERSSSSAVLLTLLTATAVYTDGRSDSVGMFGCVRDCVRVCEDGACGPEMTMGQRVTGQVGQQI